MHEVRVGRPPVRVRIVHYLHLVALAEGHVTKLGALQVGQV